MDPIASHLDHAARQARRKHLNGLMLASPMKTFPAMSDLGRQVFAEGAISKKHKELTALALAVATNCWE